VSCACRGERKTAGGYIWKYKNKWFWLFMKMCYYDVGIEFLFMWHLVKEHDFTCTK
jgi:hypothetical protein